jgi:hypothetical protein
MRSYHFLELDCRASHGGGDLVVDQNPGLLDLGRPFLPGHALERLHEHLAHLGVELRLDGPRGVAEG